MIEVVNTRKDSACVWLSLDQLDRISQACATMGDILDLDGETNEADRLYDIVEDCKAIIKEVCDEEGDY